MAIEAAQASVPLSVGARLSGLNHVAELRARFWGDSEKELTRFFAELRDKRDPCFEENTRDYRHEPFSCSRELISRTADHADVTPTKRNGVNPPGILLPEFKENE